MAYSHKNRKGETYYLHKQQVTLRGSGKKQTIYFFAREVRHNAIDDIPEGFMVVEAEKTGMPVLKRK